MLAAPVLGRHAVTIHLREGQRSDRALAFPGRAGCTIQPGTVIVSDPVDLEVAPLSDLAVSVYVPQDSGSPTSHHVGLHTAYISKGNTVGEAAMTEPATTHADVQSE